MSMKKVGIITFHDADNAGAVLQAYALQQVVETECGAKAEIIDYKCDKIAATKRVLTANPIKALPMRVYYYIKSRGFNKFRRERLKTSGESFNKQNINTCADNYDVFITGSDQVFNPECSDFDTTYFLDFAADGATKCSYAASIGTHEFEPGETAVIGPMLERFCSVSVREASALKKLDGVVSSELTIHPDPVVLLGAGKWQKIISRRLCGKKYILVYLIQEDVNVVKSAERYAQKHGCKIINNKKSIEFILHNSPADFLSWIYYAECVFTNSFHGTAFSLIFNKRLAADIQLANGGVNNRVNDMLCEAGGENCIISGGNAEGGFADAEKFLSKSREKGLEYLKNIVGLTP